MTCMRSSSNGLKSREMASMDEIELAQRDRDYYDQDSVDPG